MKLNCLIRFLGYSLIALLTYPVHAQTLHFIVFADTDDPGLSAPGLLTYDYLTKDLAPTIAKQAGLTLSLSSYKGTNCRLENLNSTLATLKSDSDDVIFFYFYGHGWNNQLNEYPSLIFPHTNMSRVSIETNSINLYDLYLKLKGIKARMTIVIGEASNMPLLDRTTNTNSGYKADSFHSIVAANPVDPTPVTLYNTQRLQQLFRATRGGLLVSSCKRSQNSISDQTGGWMGMAWKNTFRKVINDDKKLDGEPTNWPTIINQVVNETQETARAGGAVQTPQFFNELAACPTCLTNSSIGKRYALVMGNSAYQHSPSLASRPVNDANDVANRLQQLGFKVSLQTDADKKTMERSLRNFTSQIKGADVALIFYAGHGLEVNGVNYLLPVDAELNQPDDVDTEGVNVQTFLDKLKNSGAAFSIAVLDACRKIPFKQWEGRDRSEGDRGFKTITNLTGVGNMYLAMATGWNNVAQNGTGRNGVYTQSLLKFMQRGQELESVFQNVSVDVKEQTNRLQNPQLLMEYASRQKFTF